MGDVGPGHPESAGYPPPRAGAPPFHGRIAGRDCPVDGEELGLALWPDFSEPDYFARYRYALPRLRSGQPVVQMRIVARELNPALRLAGPPVFRQAIAQCERELNDFVPADRLVIEIGSLWTERIVSLPPQPDIVI